MTDAKRPRLVGLNHIALEVGSVEQALVFYGKIFRFELRGRHGGEDGRPAMAFVDMGDQFLALSEGRQQAPDQGRHFGAGGRRPVARPRPRSCRGRDAG